MKYYIYDGKEAKEIGKIPQEVKKVFNLKRCRGKAVVVFHGYCANPVEHYRAYEITSEGLRRLTGSGWQFFPFEIYLNETAYNSNWRDFIE
jgi:hypothetical protein